MSLFRNILSTATGIIPSERLCNLVEPVIIHPFYHTVSDEYLPYIHPIYSPKNSKEFIKDIDFFLRYFEPVNINKVLLHHKEHTFPQKNAFHLSFDDGLRGVYEIIFPVLLQKGISATIFINSAFVDNKDLFYRHKAALLIDKIKQKKPSRAVRSEINKILSISYLQRDWLNETAKILEVDFQDYLKTYCPYLTIEELKVMKTNGFSIGSHSIDHPLYSILNEDEQIRQTIESCRFVKDIFQETNTFFSFPHTEAMISESFFNTTGLHTDLTFGISGMKTWNNGKHIGRIDMEKRKKTQEIINPLLLKHKILKVFT